MGKIVIGSWMYDDNDVYNTSAINPLIDHHGYMNT